MSEDPPVQKKRVKVGFSFSNHLFEVKLWIVNGSVITSSCIQFLSVKHSSPLQRVVAHTFHDIVLDESKHTLIEFSLTLLPSAACSSSHVP